MKIVVTSLFKKGEFGGGVGRIAHEMAHYFAAHHDVVLMCPCEHTELHRAENGLKVFCVESAGEGHLRVPALSAKNVNRIFSFLDTFQPNAIHAHEPVSIGLMAQIWAKMHHVPFVHTAHLLPSKALDFGATEAIKLLRNPITEPLIEAWMKQWFLNFYGNCDAVIALNKFAANDIRQFGYEGRVLIIPNGRNLTKYATSKNADRSAAKKTLTFIGILNHRKNQHYLLQVLTHLPNNYRLLLIGDPLTPEYHQQLKNYTKEHNLDVVFTGRVAHDDIPSYLEQTHVFVSASKMEVQSLVVIEALASGTPVVGLSNETIDELVDDSVGTKLSKDADPADFAKSVEALCSLSQPEYDCLCENARKRVHHLDWANVMALTTEAYNTLIKEQSIAAGHDSTGLAKAISLIPPGEVREILMEQAQVLEKRIRELVDLEDGLGAKIKQVRRIPGSTWLIAGLTMPISMAWYTLLKHTSGTGEEPVRSAA